MEALILQHCKTLNLAHMAEIYGDVQADTTEEFFLKILDAEVKNRQINKVQRLIKKAAFKQIKTFEDYEKNECITLPTSTTMSEIEDLIFLEKRQNIMMLGAVGTGKSHLATAIGVRACHKGKNVRFFRVADLVSKLLEKHHNGTLARFKRELNKADIIILDELGFIPFHQDGSELLFDLISECYESASVIVTSNLEFGQWNSVFGDNRLTAAIIDRLVHHAHILSFEGISYRLKNALSKS